VALRWSPCGRYLGVQEGELRAPFKLKGRPGAGGATKDKDKGGAPSRAEDAMDVDAPPAENVRTPALAGAGGGMIRDT
jgi:hypothetical protein